MLGEAQRWLHSKEYDDVACWGENIGVIRDARRVDKSPIHAVNSIRVPILLNHRAGDSLVAIAQSERMVRDRQAAGKRVKYVKLEGEDHWMLRSEDRVRIRKEVDAFLCEHL